MNPSNQPVYPPIAPPPQPLQPNIPPEQPQGNSAREKLRGLLKSVGGTVALLILAPLLALFLTAHVFQPYEVDGISMETTLQNTDRLIVYKLPKTIANITGKEYIPKRWDIVIFDKPSSLNATEDTEHLIKRVIGLPGERVVVNNGNVQVYNKENPDGFNPDEGRDYSNGFVSTPGKTDITVGKNEIFVLGDNRTNSSDSRVFGAINVDILVGRATARFIPVNAMKRL